MKNSNEDKETIPITDLDLAAFLSAKQEAINSIEDVGGGKKAFMFDSSSRCELLINKYRYGSDDNDPDLQIPIHVIVRTRSDLLGKLKLQSIKY